MQELQGYDERSVPMYKLLLLSSLIGVRGRSDVAQTTSLTYRSSELPHIEVVADLVEPLS